MSKNNCMTNLRPIL